MSNRLTDIDWSQALPKCFGCYATFLCCGTGRCAYLEDCKGKRLSEVNDGTVIDSLVAMKAFEEMSMVKLDIQVKLMSLVQNTGFPITDDDMMKFEDDKNDIINKLNKIGLDLKIEYDRCRRD